MESALKIFQIAVALFFCFVCCANAQVFSPDERYKADLLVIVAHPDDDTLVSSYLARAVFDQHKKVAVIYCTHGDSGTNSEGRERARALGLAREMEARQAMNLLGTTNVWFLDGWDSATNNVLIALGVWPSGVVLEQILRIIRLTRPEVVLTWLPSTVAGENHGDHQAAGVLATEAFDMSGNPTAFPSQLGAPVRKFENVLEGLTPWQPKKLYYFSDAFDTGFFHGHGPEYLAKDVSPSHHVTYLHLAMKSEASYFTQAPDSRIYHQIAAGKDLDQLITKVEQVGYLDDVVRLWLGKSYANSTITGDVFEGIEADPISFVRPRPQPGTAQIGSSAELGGSWAFYHNFWREHELDSLLSLRPEIAVQPSAILTVPVNLKSTPAQAAEFTITVVLPPRWMKSDATTQMAVPAGSEASIAVPVMVPASASNSFEEIQVKVVSGGTTVLEAGIFAKVVAP